MKSRTLFLRILLVLAAADVAAAVLIEQFGFAPSIGTAVLDAFLLLLISAPIIYLAVVRPVATLAGERAALARKSAELEILNGIGANAIEGIDPVDMIRKTAEDARRLFEVPRCIVWLFGSPDTVVDDRVPGLPSAEASFPLLATPDYWKDACRSGRPAAVDDVQQSPSFRSVAGDMELLRVRSFLGIPLCAAQGAPIGVLFLCRTAPGKWNGQAPRAAEAIGRQLATAIAHLRAYRDSKEFSTSLLSLMDHVPGMVYRGQRDWTLSVASAEVEKMTGYAPKDFLNGNVLWKNLIHPDDLEMVKQTFRSAVQSRRKVLRVEYRARHRNGSWRWLADRRQLIYDDMGRFLYVDGLCLDITDRKKSETGSPGASAGR